MGIQSFLYKYKKKPEYYFQKNHSSQSIYKKSISGSITLIAREAVNFILQFITISILAHLLSPDDFGLVAISLIPIILLRALTGNIFATGAIQKHSITEKEINGFFWIMIFFSFFLTLLSIFISHVLAWFYKKEILIYTTSVLSLELFLTSIATIPTVLLTRQLEFQIVAFIDFISSLLSKIVAIWLAFNGARYWSLIGMNLSYDFCLCVFNWLFCSWRPSFQFSFPKHLIKFGSIISITSFLSTIIQQLESILIGKFVGTYNLGFYNRARNILNLPITFFLWPIETVIISSLSKFQNNLDEYKKFYFSSLENVFFFVFPAYIFVFCTCDSIIPLFLGKHWIPSISVFKILSIFYLNYSLLLSTSWFLISINRLQKYFYLSLIENIIMLIGIILGISKQETGVALGITIAIFFYMPIKIFVTFHKENLKINNFLKSFLCPFIISIIIGFEIILIKNVININKLPYIINFIIIFIVFWSLYLGHFLIFAEGKNILNKKILFIKTFLNKKKARV